ncbi:MAG: sodium ion-translocating decarboxylase subunit beta [Saccharospirillaceae bacterium]|nr:sodium ion-translocating decarboxylase subunit beta [Pseudomonadales bacterium]NRB78499.1 sodium ion-translocating decarboxylase subunit beta [Saccharospirillaceae bacterium]
MEQIIKLFHSSGIYNMQLPQAIMLVVCLFLLYLAIAKKFEPLLLVPIGFGGLLANIPQAGLALSGVEQAIAMANADVMPQLYELFKTEIAQLIAEAVKEQASNIDKVIHIPTQNEALIEAYHTAHNSNFALDQAAIAIAHDNGFANGMLKNFYNVVIASAVGPLLIFMGVGAMTDFGPLLANPKTLLLGAAAQAGIFFTVMGAVILTSMGIFDYTLPQAASIGIIGGADGPTSIFVASKLAPELLGAIAVASYSYMALVPVIQPPIMRLFTTKAEREIKMEQLRVVSKKEKIFFPLILLLLVALVLPDAAPLLGMFCLGNLMRECGVVERLSDVAQNALINIVTIFLGLSVGSKLIAAEFLNGQTMGILVLGIVAFSFGTMCGILMAKLMNLFSTQKINPLIGSAGVSAVPMAARVSNKIGLEANKQNFLLMHAMGPNVAGVIGSAVAAGVMINYFSKVIV